MIAPEGGPEEHLLLPEGIPLGHRQAVRTGAKAAAGGVKGVPKDDGEIAGRRGHRVRDDHRGDRAHLLHDRLQAEVLVEHTVDGLCRYVELGAG